MAPPPDPERYRLVFTPTRDDAAAFLLMPREAPMRHKARFVGTLILAGMAAPFLLEWLGLPDDVEDDGWTRLMTGMGIVMVGWLIHTVIGSIMMTRRLRRIPPAGPEQTVTADETGVTVAASGTLATHPWSDFGAVVHGKDHVHLCLTPDRAITVPRRAFPDGTAMADFAAFADRASAASEP